MEPKLTLSNGEQIDSKTLMGSEPFDSDVATLAGVIKKLEGGDYQNRSGDAGSSAGAYQWNNDKKPLSKGEMPSHWKNAAAQYLNDPNAPMTKENQNFVAYKQIKAYKDQGLTASEIDALWNGAKKGTSGKYEHVSAERAKKFKDEISALASGTQQASADTGGYSTSPEGYSIKSPDTTTPIVEPAKADTLVGRIKDTVATNIPGSKLAVGLGQTLANISGSQDKVIKANEESMKIQNQLIQMIRANKKAGKDTSRLESALRELTKNIKETGGQIENLGTGGLTNKEILKSAGSLATLPALAYGTSALKASTMIPSAGKSFKVAQTLPKVFRSTAVVNAAKQFGIPMKEFNTLSNMEKFNLLKEASIGASHLDRTILQQAIDRIAPLAIKEAGGAVRFAELYPGLARTGGVLGKLLKGAVGIGIAGAAGGAWNQFKQTSIGNK